MTNEDFALEMKFEMLKEAITPDEYIKFRREYFSNPESKSWHQLYSQYHNLFFLNTEFEFEIVQLCEDDRKGHIGEWMCQDHTHNLIAFASTYKGIIEKTYKLCKSYLDIPW